VPPPHEIADRFKAKSPLKSAMVALLYVSNFDEFEEKSGLAESQSWEK